MSSTKIAKNDAFTIASCGFTKSGYRFAGYNVYRSSDSAWYVNSQGWISYYDIIMYNSDTNI